MVRFLFCVSCLILASHRLLAGDPNDESAREKILVQRFAEQTKQLNELQSQIISVYTLISSATNGNLAVLPSRQGQPRFRQLYTVNRDGTGLQPFFAAPGMITTGTPQWSHDGKMVVVDSTPVTDAVVQSRIWVYGVEGAFKGMTRYLCAGNTPSWSPDDSQIAFMVNGGNPDGRAPGAWIMNADGTNFQFLGEGWYTRWSPDGKEICVFDASQQPSRLRIYNLETGAARYLLGEGEVEDIEVIFGGANWSPDGTELVTLVKRENEQQLITVDADGDRDSIRILYREPRNDRFLVGPPVMSPDGKDVVFGIQDSERLDHTWIHTYLYLISTDGNSEPRLLEGEKIGKINRSMEWSPDGKRILFSSER